MTFVTVNREALLTDLKQCVAEVRFVKADGEPRIMKCTLQRNFLPAEFGDPQKIDEMVVADKHPDILRVWSVDDNNWRTIPLNRVFSIQQMDGY
jgi:hypothetical protein